MICKLLTLALVAAVAALGYDPDATLQDEGTIAVNQVTTHQVEPPVTTWP